MEELKKCKLCGKNPEYFESYPDGGGVSSGGIGIYCCVGIHLKPEDITLPYDTKGRNGWDVLGEKLDVCKTEAIRRWNLINT